MNRLIRLLSYLYIFVGSWTLAYRVGTWFTVPNIVIILLMPLYVLKLLIKGKIKTIVYKSEDILLIFSLICIMISYLVNSGNPNYILAYFFTFIISYLLMKQICYEFCDIEKLFKINTTAILFVSIFIIVEFLGHYIFNVNIRKILHFGIIPEATYLRVFHRSYGFSTEPTNLGYYINCLGPIALWYLYKTKTINKGFKIFTTIIYILGWITTFSAATFASFLMSLFLVVNFNIYKIFKEKASKQKIFFIIILINLIIICTVAYFMLSEQDGMIVTFIAPIINKLSVARTSSNKVSAFSGRYYRWVRDLERFAKKPILGYGPGSTTAIFGASSINWYINLLVENGIFTFVFIVLFFLNSLIRILKSNIPNKNFILLGYISSLIHLMSFSTFYDPALWILLTIFHVYNERCKINDIYQ